MHDKRFKSFYSWNLYLNSFENNIPEGRLIDLSSWKDTNNLAPKWIENFLSVQKCISISQYIPPESVNKSNLQVWFWIFRFQFYDIKGK